MYYPPGNDPNKTPDINKQDQFFADLARAEARYAATLPKAPVISSPPAAPPLHPLPVGGVAVNAPTTQKPPKKPRARREVWIDRIVGLLPLALIVGAIDTVLIAADAGPPPAIIGYSVLVTAGFIAVFLLFLLIAKAIEAFFTSRVGIVMTVGLIVVAGAYLYQQI